MKGRGAVTSKGHRRGSPRRTVCEPPVESVAIETQHNLDASHDDIGPSRKSIAVGAAFGIAASKRKFSVEIFL
jgi:hypothetical protein